MIDKSKVRQIVLWVMLLDFPVLYIGAVSLDDPVLTAIGLGIMAVVALAAGIAF